MSGGVLFVLQQYVFCHGDHGRNYMQKCVVQSLAMLNCSTGIFSNVVTVVVEGHTSEHLTTHVLDSSTRSRPTGARSHDVTITYL